jgi:hypothetical protein
MAYTKKQRFDNFAYESIMKTLLEAELTPSELDSPFLEDVCPNTRINLKNHTDSLFNLMV